MLARVITKVIPKNFWKVPRRTVSTYNDEEVEKFGNMKEQAKNTKKICRKTNKMRF